MQAGPSKQTVVTVTAEDLEQTSKRVQGFEAGILGSLLTGETILAPWEQAFCVEHEIDISTLKRCFAGDDRLLRIQPTKVLVDIKKKDLLVHCQLPPETAIVVLLNEVMKPSEAVI